MDVVTDIISRLPVKSVFQSRCISKDFSSISSNSHFINALLQQSARLRPSIIVDKWDIPPLIQCSSAPGYEITVQEAIFHPDLDLHCPDAVITRIVGSSNGLLLVINRDECVKCYVWNPSTRKCDTHIPALSEVPYLRLSDPSWAFGYCSETREYKIVRIARYCNRRSQIEYLVEVLSYGKDSEWRRLYFSNFAPYYLNDNGLTVNGVVYWIVNPDETWLLTFDLTKEIFGRICCLAPKGRIGQIMEFKGMLTICHKYKMDEEAFGFHLWVLKDESSWEKMYTFEYLRNMEPVQCLNDRYLLLLNQSTFSDEEVDHSISEWPCCLYDMKNEEFKEIPGMPIVAYTRSNFYKFVESIVALHGP